MARLQDQFREKIAPALIEKFGYTTPMQVPRITKITLNMGVSEAVADKKAATAKVVKDKKDAKLNADVEKVLARQRKEVAKAFKS